MRGSLHSGRDDEVGGWYGREQTTAKAELLWRKGWRVEVGRSSPGSFALERSARMTAETSNGKEQATTKCGGPSTDHPNEQVRSSGTPVAAEKYAASGRDDGRFALLRSG
jgi:hypothetical protein